MMNTLDDCDLLEKVVNMTNVSIKVQQFRSRCLNYVYHNCTHIVCDCFGYKRNHESSEVPVRMLKHLSQKIRKLQSFVRSRLSKNEPKSSKVHDHVKNNATRKKSTHKTRVRFVQKMRRKPIFRTRNVNCSMRYVYNSSRIVCSGYLKYLTFFSCNLPYSEYEGVIQRDNCRKKKLHNDIEKTLFLVCTMWIPVKQ